jgi:hypothetical protein
MIKVLVATTETQGDHPGDFCFVPDGELVARYGMVCDDERPDGSGCGCGRSFSGFDTHRATTSAMVVEKDMTREEWRAALHRTLTDSGWIAYLPADEAAEVIDEIERFDLDGIQQIPAGLVLGRQAYNEDRATTDRLLFRLRPAA